MSGWGEKMRSLILVACVAWLAFPAGLNAQNFSGNTLNAECQAAANAANRPNLEIPEMAMAAVCTGVVAMAIEASDKLDRAYRFCPPREVTIGQAIMVLAKGMRERPQDLHLDVRVFALALFRQTWPCR